MDTLIKMIMVALSAVFVQNIVFTKSLGTSTLLMVTKDKKSILPFGISISYFCVMSSAVTYFVDKLLKDVEDNFLYYAVSYVIVIGLIYIITLLVMWKFFYDLFLKTKVFMHLSAFNCAVLGVLFINKLNEFSFIECIVFGLFTGVGFFIATFIVSVAYDKLGSEKVPESFRGFPATMLYIGIISMAFFALVSKGPVL